MGRTNYFIAAALSCSFPLLNANPGDGTAEDGSVEPSREEVQVVCRLERVTGSHFKRRVCRTPEMIAEEKKELARYVEELERLEAAAPPRTQDW